MDPNFLGFEPDEYARALREVEANSLVKALVVFFSVSLLLGIGLCSRALLAQTPGNASFEAGSADDQLVLDATPIPVGMGAIFVPTLTDPSLEPTAVVLTNGRRITTVRLGQRAIVPPGTYEVAVGHGPLESRPRTSVTVIDGVTTPVDPFFGALRIEIVAQGGEMRATNYMLVSESGVTLGPVESSAEPTYSSSKTWLVEPGLLSIVLGSDPDATENRILLPVQKGKVLRYRIVFDGDRIVRTEFADERIVAEKQWWRLRWTVGSDASVNRTTNQLSNYNGDIIQLGAFTDAEFGADVKNNIFQLKVDIDQSWVGLDSQQGSSLPFQKIVDEASLELLYTYRLGGIVGPYVRARGRTSLFASSVYVDEPTTLVRGAEESTVDAGQDIKLFDAFEPAFIHVGGGVGVAPIDSQHFTVFLRAGVGNRWALFGDGYRVSDRSDARIELARLNDDTDFGFEGDAELEVRLLRSLRLSATGELFIPQDQVFDSASADFKPEYRVGGMANLSLNSFASLIYRVSVHRDSTQLDDLQMLNGLQLRIQHSFF